MKLQFKEAMDYITMSMKRGSVMGTETEKELLRRLGNPQNALKIIHIAGTNGKGSTLAMISTILKTAGYRVGRYISPTLITYLERIQINGIYISEEAFADIISQIAEAAETMKKDGMALPTAFEIETAAAFLYFYREKCNFVVLETGMGGRDDATNVIDHTLCCVFTSIGMDHVGILGNTLQEIAANKAGIIKDGSHVITAEQEYAVLKELKKASMNHHGSFHVSDFHELVSDISFSFERTEFFHKKYGQLAIHLLGTYQINNACLAISCVDVLKELGYNVTDTALKKGLMDTEWFGRFSVAGEKPLFILDGAHNPPAAMVLEECILQYLNKKVLNGRSLVYIMGIFADKDVDSIMEHTVPYADQIFTIKTPDNPRAMDSEILAQKIQEKFPSTAVKSCNCIEEAVKEAVNYKNGQAVVLAFGSLSHLNRIREAYINGQRENHGGCQTNP